VDPVPDAEEIAYWQAEWNLPLIELDRVVREATRSKVASSERILEGHGHEVHAVTTDSGEGAIVRVAWREGPAFDRETWPAEVARSVGVPAPRQLLIEHTTVGGSRVSINVQERLPGLSVYRLRPTLGHEQLARLTTQAGELLAAVHALEVAGTGALNEHGHVDAELGTTWTLPLNLSDRSTELVSQGVDRTIIERTTDTLMKLPPIINPAPTRLVHGDWTLANLLSDGTRITGVVDWEGSGGGDPATELRGWDFWHDSGPTSSDKLLAAYVRAGGSVDEEFAHRRTLYTLVNLLDALSHFIFTDRADLLDRATEAMHRTLDRADAFL
jgi:aminoglycoside phosphotransferase (APT) family kinase protein